MSHGEQTRAAERLPVETWYTVAGLAAVFSAGAIAEAVRLSSLRDPEIWGHLRTGAWILENKSVPRFGIVSQAANLPWRDFSWGFDVVAVVGYRALGLRVVPLLAMAFLVVATAVLFLLGGGRYGRSVAAAGLTLVGIYTLSTVGPSPTGLSVVLFGIEFLMLLHWRQRQDSRSAFALPALFLLWANFDLGYVYGMMMMALFAVSVIATPKTNQPGSSRNKRGLVRNALIVFAACLAVSGITPYGFAGYAAFWQMETSPANLNIPGYAAMGFRQPLDYVVLILGMAAFLTLGLKRSRDVFLASVLCGSAALAVHSQRENWLLIVSSIGVIGAMYSAENVEPSRAPRIGIWGPAIIATAFFLLIPSDVTRMMNRVAQTFPVKACDYIRNERLPQPLFNAYEWGAFVTWYLPEYPVAIDARRGLYPEEIEADYFKVMKVELPYQSLPALRDARTILLPKSNVLAGGLRNVPGFRVAYEDDVAIVLLQGAKE